MATAAQQRRFRAGDRKATIQVRLSAEAAARLDRLIGKCGAAGRGEVIEALLLAQGRGESPAWMLHESIRLGREFLRIARTDEGTLRDGDGWYYTITRTRNLA